jgi:hypothetical protein
MSGRFEDRKGASLHHYRTVLQQMQLLVSFFRPQLVQCIVALASVIFLMRPVRSSELHVE